MVLRCTAKSYVDSGSTYFFSYTVCFCR